MKQGLIHIIGRSITYNKSGVIYLVAVIAILTAVITGSMTTGSSVRGSLRKTVTEKLGNTGILISSSTRYFDPSLVERVRQQVNEKCTGFLEMNGYLTKLSDGRPTLDIKIYAVEKDFFDFQSVKGLNISKGEAIINAKLAETSGIKAGDEIAIHFKPVNDLPADAPFAPERNAVESVVLKVKNISGPAQSGNFSLGISQITPENIFVNIEDIPFQNSQVVNRLILDRGSKLQVPDIDTILKKILRPDDIGLKIRQIPSTRGSEIISNRIFIDQQSVDQILDIFPSASPVITYMVNDFKSENGSTPYSFISALPAQLYTGVPEGNGININRWLSEDLHAKVNDTLILTWYSPDPLNRLTEISGNFIVKKITDLQGIWSDSLLMPEFPGISGKESCTDWDAGAEIKMNRIRKKDEEYWNIYRGLPKAFINYETGKKIWGSNFGPATSVRFPEDTGIAEIREKLEGKLDPSRSGFTITDLPAESLDAANKSVDFSTLFLGLGFFLIVSAVVLMVLVTGTYFESKRKELNTLISIGFSDRWIRRFILIESLIISLTGAAAGVILGWLFNLLIIKALNSVWQGSVQTNTLTAGFNPVILSAGFVASEVLILLIIVLSLKSYLKGISTGKKVRMNFPRAKTNLIILFISLILFSVGLICSLIFSEYETILSFCAGAFLFTLCIFSFRHYYLSHSTRLVSDFRNLQSVSRRFYSFHSDRAIMPVIFIAAGLFAVIITGMNRLNINESMLEPSGGTGGYLLWGESAIPVIEDLNSRQGKREFGLDEDGFEKATFVQAFKSQGNDASCLNLNHITSPPLLGIDPSGFIRNGSFSFATGKGKNRQGNPWELLNSGTSGNTVYGIADQTVLQYGLKIKPGDTLSLRAETGEIVNVIIAAGLKSSIFQGYVLIGVDNFRKFFPSVSGSQIFLLSGERNLIEEYKKTLNLRMANYGAFFEPAEDRLASFFVVTNTYLSVFSILGGMGIILGVAGLGFILLRNFSQRKKEFGLMMSAGFSIKDVRRMVFMEHAVILLWGVLTGVVSSLIATLPSLMNSTGIPWMTILLMIILVIVSGITALSFSLRSVRSSSLIASIRNE